MMMPMPEELIVLLAICGLGALWLLWVSRAEWMPAGKLDAWKLLEDAIGLYLLLAMLIASLIQVVVRYALSDTVTLPWTEEFSRLAMVWAAFWGAAVVQRSDDHISMTILYDFMPEGVRRAMLLFCDLVILAVLAPVTWLGWQTAVSLDIMYTISLGMPLSVFAYPVPIGGGLMMIHTVLLMIRRLRGLSIPSAGVSEI